MKTKLLSLFIIVIFNTLNAQSILYVDINATGANNGGSWNDAFTDLHTAMTLGVALNRDVWVAAGTYVPSTSSRSASFTLTSNLRMYGGFNGTETTLAERDINANPTILSGDISGNDNATITNTEATRADNSYHVIKYSGAVTGVTVDGFTITGGNANGSTPQQKRGAAIFSENASNGITTSLNFWNCTIEKNTATDAAVFYHDLISGVTNTISQIDFNNSIIRNNYSVDQANVFLVGNRHFSLFSRIAFTGCLIYDNVSVNSASFIKVWSSSFGGAVGGASYFYIKNCTITENTGLNNKVTQIVNGFSYECQLYNSIIYNNGSATPFDHSPAATSLVGSNYMLIDPLFVNPVADNFRISGGSFAKDSGDNSKVPAFLTTDILGNNRIFNATVDMGAFEFDPTLSLDTRTKVDFKMYPNPVSNILNIKTEISIKEISVLDVLGKQVLQTKEDRIDVSSLTQGLYLIKIKGEEDQLLVKRFVKN